MKRETFVLVPCFVLALAATALAQGGGKPVSLNDQNGDTMKVTVGGGVNLDWVFRSGEVVERRAEGLGAGATASDDANTFEGRVFVRFDVELSNKISAAIEVSNQRLDGTSGDGGVGTTWGSDAESSGAFISEANIKLGEVLSEQFDLTVGVVKPSFNIRGKGGSLVFDPRNSDQINTTLSSATNLPQGANELQPTGFVGTYGRDALSLDIWLLPALDEGGAASADEAAYGFGLYYKLDQFGAGSRLGVLAISFDDAANDFNVWTYGAGATIQGLMEGLEVFAEFYLNTGDAGTTGTGSTVDAKGTCIQVGANYAFAGMDSKPWVEGKLTQYSGDDTAGDDEEENFLSYESVSDLLILEDQYYGLNVRSNYSAIKILGGMGLSMGAGTNNVELSVGLGIAQAVEDITAAAEDDLGNEIDVKIKYNLSKQASLTFALGYLTGSDALETLTTDGADTGDDTLWAFVLGFDVRF